LIFNPTWDHPSGGKSSLSCKNWADEPGTTAPIVRAGHHKRISLGGFHALSPCFLTAGLSYTTVLRVLEVEHATFIHYVIAIP
jgi:hypothetical protein